MKKINNLSDLKEIKEKLIKKAKTKRKLITICGGTGCHASGCKRVINAFKREVKKSNFENRVTPHWYKLLATGTHKTYSC